ncbi:MAG: hypothetical protein KDD51_08870 [Bdellovibrionales bacterium]|nr:hypothetical protein [Bdellovibrionales bacterium]
MLKLLKIIGLGMFSSLLISACGENPQPVKTADTAIPALADVPVVDAEPVPAVDPMEDYWAWWVLEVPTSYGRKVHTLTLASNENGKFLQSETTCYYGVATGVSQVRVARALAPIAILQDGSFYSLAGTETDEATYTDQNGTVHNCEAAIRSGQYRLSLDQNDKMWVEQPAGNAAGIPRGPYTRNDL